MGNIDINRLKFIAAMDDEEPSVSTIDPQIRTSKYATFGIPKEPELAIFEDE